MGRFVKFVQREDRPFLGGVREYFIRQCFDMATREIQKSILLFFISFFSLQLNFKDRVISYKAEGRVHKLKWVYDGTAWDVESGITVKTKHYHSKHGAIEHAVKELIDKLKANGIITNS